MYLPASSHGDFSIVGVRPVVVFVARRRAALSLTSSTSTRITRVRASFNSSRTTSVRLTVSPVASDSVTINASIRLPISGSRRTERCRASPGSRSFSFAHHVTTVIVSTTMINE